MRSRNVRTNHNRTTDSTPWLIRWAIELGHQDGSEGVVDNPFLEGEQEWVEYEDAWLDGRGKEMS